MPNSTGGSSRRSDDEANKMTLRIMDLFLTHKLPVAKIAETLTREEGRPFSRTLVYSYIQRSPMMNILRLVPPHLADMKKAEFVHAFGIPSDCLWVADVENPNSSPELVTELAADVVRDLTIELGQRKNALRAGESPTSRGGRGSASLDREVPAVGIGLGTGSLSLDFAKAFARVMRVHNESDPAPFPKCNLHALVSAYPPKYPQFCPMSFFALFADHFINERIGLMTEPMVSCADFDDMCTNDRRFGFYRAYQRREEIDIVVTAMGGFGVSSDLYRQFLEDTGLQETRVGNVDGLVKEYGLVGNVQYRAYTETGAFLEKEHDPIGFKRPPTLFELKDFSRIATTKDRFVVLIVRRSSRDTPASVTNRARALLPLLRAKKGDELRVFSHLIIDVVTANEVLRLHDQLYRDGTPRPEPTIGED